MRLLTETRFYVPRSGFAIGNVAVKYSALGKHEEVREMLERLLDFNRRVLPESHPDLGELHGLVQRTIVYAFLMRNNIFSHEISAMAMGNLATTYSSLGKYNEALCLHLEVLEFHRRALPENHPQIGEGDTALLLLLYFLSLPDNVPFVFVRISGVAMGKAAMLHTKLGQHNQALALQEKVLEFNLRLLPENHPDIGENLLQCAATSQSYFSM